MSEGCRAAYSKSVAWCNRPSALAVTSAVAEAKFGLANSRPIDCVATSDLISVHQHIRRAVNDTLCLRGSPPTIHCSSRVSQRDYSVQIPAI